MLSLVSMYHTKKSQVFHGGQQGGQGETLIKKK